MTLLVDASVWSLALRRDAAATEPEVRQLKEALLGAYMVVTTGLVLQELLQGSARPQAREQIIDRFERRYGRRKNAPTGPAEA